MSRFLKSRDFSQMPQTLRIHPEVQTLNTGLKIATAFQHLASLAHGPYYLTWINPTGMGKGMSLIFC